MFSFWIKTLRLYEIGLMTGFSFVGLLFVHKQNILTPKLAMLVVAVISYVIAVYFLNSFADYAADTTSKRLYFLQRLSRKKYLVSWLFFSVMFISLTASISAYSMLFCVVAMFLWMLYYLPPFRLKSTLFWGSIIHFVAGLLHFLSCYGAYDNVSIASILVGSYFSLLLCMGHINHELIDYEDDFKNNNRTTTVRLGKNFAAGIRSGISLVIFVYWLIIWWVGYVDTAAAILFTIANFVIVLVGLSLHNRNSERKFQYLSRLVYLMAGTGVALTRFFC